MKFGTPTSLRSTQIVMSVTVTHLGPLELLGELQLASLKVRRHLPEILLRQPPLAIVLASCVTPLLRRHRRDLGRQGVLIDVVGLPWVAKALRNSPADEPF